MNTENQELHFAETFVEQTSSSIFLTGKAGTGKTTFLHTIKQQSRKRLVVTAPTGVAAINAGGVTLHSFFQLPFTPFLPNVEQPLEGNLYRMGREKRNIIKSLDLLVIDEISMVRADLLDAVDAVLRRYRNSARPFGGVQLLMIGDLYQLAPVVKDVEWQLLQQYYASPYFFDSVALQKIAIVPIELQKIYRQPDQHFIDLLNKVRDSRLDASSIASLNARYRQNYLPDEGVITLCTHNARADVINQNKMKALPAKSHLFNAFVEGSFPEYAYPTAASLELKVGAQVMFVRNDNRPEKRYFNGKIGMVTALRQDKIIVTCPEEGETIDIEPVTWEHIEYKIDAKTSEISSSAIGTFKQYPLKPAWAITIHKSQGLTFDKAVVDANAAFAHGQVYVALSRCRTLEGLVLSSPLSTQAVKADRAVSDFTAALQSRFPDVTSLINAKIIYQQQLLRDCFNFQLLAGLMGRLAGLLRSREAIIQLAGAQSANIKNDSERDFFAVRQQAMEKICDAGERFVQQLQLLFTVDKEPINDQAVQERLRKAGIYFGEQFEIILKPWLESFAFDADNREIKKRISETFKLLRQECHTKLAGIVACEKGFSPESYLRALSIAEMREDEQVIIKREVNYSESDVGCPELFKKIRKWRAEQAKVEDVPAYMVISQKAVTQIAIYMPDSTAALMSVKGIGKRTAEKYGSAILDIVCAYRKENGIETVDLPLSPTGISDDKKKKIENGKTKHISLEMLERGLSIDEIMEQRGLTRQTVEGHLSFFVKSGALSIDVLMPEERRCTMEKKFKTLPPECKSLGAIKIALSNEYSYGEIKLLLAYRQLIRTKE